MQHPGTTSSPPEGEPQQQLIDYLRRKDLLLIMGNLEHLFDRLGVIIGFLRTAPGITTLVTSRVRLNTQCEHLFPVAGMNISEEETLEARSETFIQ